MGYPHIQPKIYAFLKAHPDQPFTATGIREAIKLGKGGGTAGSLKSLAEKHPAVLKLVPMGKRIFAIKYVPVANGARHAAVEAPEAKATQDVLITIPIGDKQNATLDLPAAKRVYDQLAEIFGRGS